MRPESRAPIAPGLHAVAPGLLWIEESRALVAADAHFAYEDVIGGVLPTWSTGEVSDVVRAAAMTLRAREIIFLGDIIHGAFMSEGAAAEVRAALERLRAVATVTLVAGNHEGRTRGADVLGETVEYAERAGWLLAHGDRDVMRDGATAVGTSRGVVIGHLHPSVRNGGASAPAFIAGERIVVVPALTPYSSGLDVCSDDCFNALERFGARSRTELRVFAATSEYVYALGSLSALRSELHRPQAPARRNGYRRKFLRSDR